jgi:hypothetical protein
MYLRINFASDADVLNRLVVPNVVRLTCKVKLPTLPEKTGRNKVTFPEQMTKLFYRKDSDPPLPLS